MPIHSRHVPGPALQVTLQRAQDPTADGPLHPVYALGAARTGTGTGTGTGPVVIRCGVVQHAFAVSSALVST